MFDVNTFDVRRFFSDVWQNRLSNNLDAIQQKALRIILAHPEYHHYLENIEDYLDFNWSPELGETNPFLHMSLHLSIQEQATIDQPFGIQEIHTKLCEQKSDWIEAEHLMMEALAEMIWQAQRYNQGFDVNTYISNLRKLIGLGQEDKPRLNPHEV